MTANYFVTKNLIQNQLMGDKVIRRYTSTEHKIRSYLYLSECAGSLLQIFLAALSILLQRSLRRNNSITGACQILPRASFNFVSHLKQIVVQMGLTITVSTGSLREHFITRPTVLQCQAPLSTRLQAVGRGYRYSILFLLGFSDLLS